MADVDATSASRAHRGKPRKSWFAIVLLVVDYVIKIAASGTIPENRKSGSSFAWLMLVLFVPVIGLPLFLLLGSPYVTGRRHRIQGKANDAIASDATTYPESAKYIRDIVGASSIVDLNRRLASFPLVTGRHVGLHGDYEESIRAMATAVGTATDTVHVEICITAWDKTTDNLLHRPHRRCRARCEGAPAVRPHRLRRIPRL